MRLAVRNPSAIPTILRPSQHFGSAQRRFRSSSSEVDALSPRWLADVKQRIGRCMVFGLKPEQIPRAGAVLHTIARDWRELVAGSEGFLTTQDRKGLFRQEVVWGEMDSMVGHVNNVMYNRYAESARVNWCQNFAAIDPPHRKEWSELLTPRGIGLILASIRTDYRFPMKYPDHISVYHKLSQRPSDQSTSRFGLDVLILSELHQRPAARCSEDIVLYDYTIGKRAPMPDFMMRIFSETYNMQEDAKQNNTKRVKALLDEVRSLEVESWDREDAVEDLGVASQQ